MLAGVRGLVMVGMVVNGRAVQEEVAGRVHLADFLRERLLLTGTHLGCEHGVCGACTVLIDGEPARACIAYAAGCEGADVRTIEGLEDDAVAARLRVAFSAQHALQCGYCTPGMMVTARDIVLRLPDASDDDIRLELAGNLCRCTGYNGIVRAIRQVLDERRGVAGVVRGAVAVAAFGGSGADPHPDPPHRVEGADGPDVGEGLRQRLRFAVAPGVLWAALRDPGLIAGCVPGATLTAVAGDRVEGAMVVSLGPVRARFKGAATLAYDDAAMAGTVTGGGSDQGGGTLLSASAAFRVAGEGEGCVLAVDVTYALRGALAQLARPRVVALVADAVAAAFAGALRGRLAGEDAGPARSLSGAGVAWGVLVGWVRGVLRRGAGRAGG